MFNEFKRFPPKMFDVPRKKSLHFIKLFVIPVGEDGSFPNTLFWCKPGQSLKLSGNESSFVP